MSGCGAEKGLISVDQALAMIIETVKPLASKKISLQHALHHYLATDIYSKIDLPLFSQSAVDGYALCSHETILTDAQFELVGEIRAGQDQNLQLAQGQALRIFTGAQIPEGTTTVARQEIVKVLGSNQIQIETNLATHADIRDVGEELSKGQLLANQGLHLTVGAIAALSMAGVTEVEVYCYPRVAVVITGDEVAQNLKDFAAGMIFDANAPLIQAWFAERQQQVQIFHVADTEFAVVQLIQQLKQSIHHLKQLDDAMIQLAQQLDYFENIHSIPGIGKLSTAMIIGEIGDIKRFKSNKQLNAFVGIDIKRYQSGHTHCRDTINKRGNKKARKLLFWVIMNIIRGQHHYDNHVVDYYYKLRKQPNEKPHKTAIIACINRLLKTIHYLVMNHKLYDYQMSPH